MYTRKLDTEQCFTKAYSLRTQLLLSLIYSSIISLLPDFLSCTPCSVEGLAFALSYAEPKAIVIRLTVSSNRVVAHTRSDYLDC
jgi:hypothetical protein